MASKRRNMFHKNKTQETTEKGRDFLKMLQRLRLDVIWFHDRAPKVRDLKLVFPTGETEPARSATSVLEPGTKLQPPCVTTCSSYCLHAIALLRHLSGRVILSRYPHSVITFTAYRLQRQARMTRPRMTYPSARAVPALSRYSNF
ncbi:hypothetical protein AAG570_004815 [Ranatra chinensis]|uniref:Uncharacterized protein n=1 Tax=Ranatra chinensis TaxID=642074 RepID=A0ABD0Y2Q1_9HEMI